MNRWGGSRLISISCGFLAITLCCVVGIFASCQALRNGNGTTKLSTTVESVQPSPIVTSPAPSPSPVDDSSPTASANVPPTSSSTEANRSDVTATVSTSPASKPSTPSATPASTSVPTAAAESSQTTQALSTSCRISSASEIGPGGDQDWSHTNGMLAFDRKDASGVYQLYVGDPGNGDYRCLTCTSHPGGPPVDRHKTNPVWSPNGSFIVLEGEMAQHPLERVTTNNLMSELVSNGVWSDLYATTADGSTWVKLTDTSPLGPDGVMMPAFSPDGTKLMWSRLVQPASIGNPFGIWHLLIADFVVNQGVPSLQNVRDITPPGARFIESHVFSPDGRTVMFSADINSANAFAPDIWTLDLSTGVARNLTHDSSWDEHAVFTLDGKSIVYMSSSPYPGTFLEADLMIMDIDGSHKRQFSHFNVVGYPEYASDRVMPIRVSWSSMATELAVTLQSGTKYPNRSLWIVKFAGSCGT